MQEGGGAVDFEVEVEVVVVRGGAGVLLAMMMPKSQERTTWVVGHGLEVRLGVREGFGDEGRVGDGDPGQDSGR